MSNVKVAVRIRPPQNPDDAPRSLLQYNAGSVVLQSAQEHVPPSMRYLKDRAGAVTAVPSAADRVTRSQFSFDEVYGPGDNQRSVFSSIGKELLDNVWAGYNCSVLAYGQTGSGKTHTMIGTRSDPGLIPRFAKALFNRIEENRDANVEFKLEVSLLEIYNELIYDLLDGSRTSSELKLREHPILGPYVEGLTRVYAKSFEEVGELIEQGFEARTTASTAGNKRSSRSHAVFSVVFTQRTTDPISRLHFDRVSRINMVDLAGSERAGKAEGSEKTVVTSEARMKETREINTSLLALGRVIKSLSEGTGGHIPYRDSILTWLLRESLGGNSKTAIVASVSGHPSSYEETLNTLRYASSAKRIVNVACVNEDPNARLIGELRAQVESLREREGEGSLREPPRSGEQPECRHLINLNRDIALHTTPLVVPLREGSTLVGGHGKEDVSSQSHVFVPGLLPAHCEFVAGADECVLRVCEGATVAVNGQLVEGSCTLMHGAVILVGDSQLFWYKEAPITLRALESSARVDEMWQANGVNALLREMALGQRTTPPAEAHMNLAATKHTVPSTNSPAHTSAAAPTSSSAVEAAEESDGETDPELSGSKAEIQMVSLTRELNAQKRVLEQADRELAYSLECYTKLKLSSDAELGALEAKVHELQRALKESCALAEDSVNSTQEQLAVTAAVRAEKERLDEENAALLQSKANADAEVERLRQELQVARTALKNITKETQRNAAVLRDEMAEALKRSESVSQQSKENAAPALMRVGDWDVQLQRALKDMGIHVPMSALRTAAQSVQRD